MIVRIAVFDETILGSIRQHRVDLVLNLAAGLDTRPWRLELPESLRWVDVDLPEILDHKLEVMQGEQPRCRYEAVRADLTDAAVRQELFARLGRESARALVVSEGLLIYLGVADVGALAQALHAEPAFQWWLTDLASPRLLKWMHKRWSRPRARRSSSATAGARCSGAARWTRRAGCTGRCGGWGSGAS